MKNKIKSILSGLLAALGSTFTLYIILIASSIMSQVTKDWNYFYSTAVFIGVTMLLCISDNAAKTRRLLEAQNEILDESEEVEEEISGCGGNCRCGKN